MKLTDFNTLTFDCYGTLIDWESGMIAGLKPLTDQLNPALSRDSVLQTHARHESRQQRWTPQKKYPEILATVYKRIAEEWGITVSAAECKTYGESVKNWPAFDDSTTALQYLKNHFKLIVLSNVDNTSFAASNEKLQVTFDAIITAEDVGSYKPNERNFDYMLEQLDAMQINTSDVLHTAESMFHDHVPAGIKALSRCWIYRRHQQEGYGATMNPGEQPSVEFQFNSMAELAEAHKAALEKSQASRVD